MTDTPESVLKLCKTLQDAGHQAYLVGGCVRDTLMSLTPKDWDVTTSARPEQVQALFKRVMPTGIDYGTVTVMMGKEPIEVTTFRADSPSTDGRRPDSVTYSNSLTEDLARRDFTCNAIAYDPIADKLYDPHGGVEDINNKVLRAVGTPIHRFREDGLRVMRAIRFCATKGFEMEEDTSLAVFACIDMLDSVSKERIRDELLKTLGSQDVGRALSLMMNYPILSKICPEIVKQLGLSQNQWHTWEVWEHTRQCVMAEKTGDPMLRLAILLHDISKPETRAPHPKIEGDFQFIGHEHLGAERAAVWMKEYKFSRDEVYMVVHCIKHHLIFYTPDWSDQTLRRWLRKVGPTYLDELLALRRADIAGKGSLEFMGHYLVEHDQMLERIIEVQKEVPHSTAHLALRGNEIMKIRGLDKGGSIIGDILDHLLEVVTDDPSLNTAEGLTPLVEKFNEY